MDLKLNQIRDQFPALAQLHNDRPVTFFDGPGGSQVPQSVLDSMVSYLGRFNSNLGGHYFSSYATVDLMQTARESAQVLLNAPSPDNIVFGANMTSLTFKLSRAISRDWQFGDEIIVSALDHYANVSSWQQAAEDKGAVVHQIRINEHDCTLDLEHLQSLLLDKTRLVAMTFASNATGSIVDMQQVVQMAHQVGAQVFVDAVHYVPHHLVDVQALGCDFLACSAYKFFGPHVGITYIADQWLHSIQPYKVEPATNSGPGRFETGTQSFEALAGFVAVVEYLAQFGEAGLSLRQRLEQSFVEYNKHEQRLSERLLKRLSESDGVKLFGIGEADSQLRTPTFALTFEKHSPETIAKKLGEQNICVWNGHFYAIGLVRQLGLEESGGVVRIGCMHYNTIEEVDKLIGALDIILQT